MKPKERSGFRLTGPPRGFSLVEILVIVAVIGLLAAIATPLAGKFIRRARDLSAVTTLSRELIRARLLAIQRGFNVCVRFGTVPGATDPSRANQVQLLVWEDRPDRSGANTGKTDFSPGTYLDKNGAAQNEVVLGSGAASLESTVYVTNPADLTNLPWVRLEPTVHLGGPSTTMDDLATNVQFNNYAGSAGSVDGVVAFTPTGAIVPPPCCTVANITTTAGRGIYLRDSTGKNFFRVTIYSDLTAKPTQEMYVNGAFTASNWIWK